MQKHRVRLVVFSFVENLRGCDMKRKSFLSLLLILVFCGSVLLAGCGSKEPAEQNSEAAKAPQTVDVIRLAGGDWGYPTPWAHYSRGPGGYKMQLIFDSLLERDEKGLIPWLAEEYEVRKGGKEYLFTIRDGVKWQDGKPLTPEDVKFTFEYLLKHPAVWSKFFQHDIEKVEVVGDNQVLITVASPGAHLLDAFGSARIVPKHIWEKVEKPEEFLGPEAVIGSGPYKLTDYSKEHGTYRLEAYEGFWGPKQRVKVLEFVPVSDEVLAFENGEIDLAEVTPDLLSRFEKDPQCKISQNPGFWGYRLLFNMGDYPILAEREFRQAVSFALDKKELVDKVERGAAIPGSAGILPPDHVMYNPKTSQYEHNPEKAAELLAGLGYDSLDADGVRQNDRGEKLSFSLLVSDQEVRLAELIKEQLAGAGIEIKVESAASKSRDARVLQYKYQLAINGHGGWGNDPDYLRERFAGQSKGGKSPSVTGIKGYNNPELNKLLEKQHLAMEPEVRKKIVGQIQEKLAEEVPEIPLYYTTGYKVYRPARYDGWMYMFDHHELSHSKLSYLERD